ncbi:MAG: DUF3080 family protein [Calditrichia bacterium]
MQYPRHRDLFIPIDEVRISLLDFSLDDCDLQILVAERNNAMGKVMSSPQILVYEHQFLVKLHACLDKLSMESDGSKEWQAQLARLIHKIGEYFESYLECNILPVGHSKNYSRYQRNCPMLMRCRVEVLK